MPNSTHYSCSPPLPTYTSTPIPPLLPFISYLHLSLLVPSVTYWTLGLIFHWFDTTGSLQRYRIHTPAESETRNRISGTECLRGVLFDQLLQTLLGIAAGWGADDDFCGDEDYQIAVWATRVQFMRRILSNVLAVLAIDGDQLVKSLGMHKTSMSGSPIEYSWQYFGHRWMHSNKFMYKNIHSRHHTLYVPYAYGSLYTHPLEGLLQDTLGVALAFYLTNMSTRQGILFYFGSTVKDVYDRCGYALPCDKATFHDLHHQSWGMKSNFSVYTCFWDRVFGTLWTDEEKARSSYRRGMETAGKGKGKGMDGEMLKEE